MLITIHQPQYLPWVPYFDKILRSNVFVILDNVQFQKNGVQNRNQIKTSQGPTWLSVPVKHSLGQLILETEIADQRAVTKQLKTIEMNYKKSTHFEEVMNLLEPVIRRNHQMLSELNYEVILQFLKYLGYEGRVIKASDLPTQGKGSALILNICKELKASSYLSGSGGRNYICAEAFDAANIKIIYQSYQTVEYPQLFEHQGFIKDLSVLDLMFNVGKASRAYIERGRLS